MNSYKEYLVKLHSKFVTPDNVISDLIKKGLGKSIAKKERIIAGETNEIYNIILSEGNDVILRISHGSCFSFASEQWVLEECRKINIPVPRMFYYEDFKINDKHYSACVLEKLKGSPLDTVMSDKDWNEHDTQNFLIETGRLLARMHTIRPKKFGHIRSNGTGEDNSWYEFITRHKDKKEHLQKELLSRGGNPQDIDTIYDIFETFKDQLEVVQPHLVHGDIGYDHIFVDSKKVTGIIDFGIAKSGEPMHDLAWWDFFHTDKTGLHFIEEGYQQESPLPSDYDTRRHIEKLFLSIQLFNYYVDSENEQGVQITLREMKNGLMFFGRT